MGFDLRALRPAPGSDTLACFVPCVYSTAKKEELLLDALHHVKDEVGNYRERVFKRACELDPNKAASTNKEQVVTEFLRANPSEQAPAEDFQRAVILTRINCFRIAALLKNSAFEEEQEWRLVLPTLLEEQAAMKNPPQFRVGKTTLIPYVAHPFASGRPFPLVDVILGPGSDGNAVIAAERFLELQGLNIKPRLSTVPYRAS